jgi:protein-tyrosine phosphatase
VRILIVCTGNICRSQLAAGYLRKILKDNEIDDVAVETAGINAREGLMIPPGVNHVSGSNGLILSGESGRQINRAMIERADMVLVMEYAQASYILELEPKSLDKIKIIGRYNPGSHLSKEMRDPLTFEARQCQSLFERIRPCVDVFYLQEIIPRRKQSAPATRTEDQAESRGEEENPDYFHFTF